MAAVIDESSEFGARVAAHLRDEVAVWFTTVTPAGAPLPAPVWFIWDGSETVQMFSMDGARVRNLEGNPRVTLNFGGNGQGGDIVVLHGRAAIERDGPGAAESAEYVTKYAARIERLGLSPEGFAARYKVPVRIRITRVGGH
jgi:PPOX class probable F420-dependent enzyme